MDDLSDIYDQINNLEVKEVEHKEARWVEKGAYGNGTAFAPLVPLHVCSNCGAMSVELFDMCPECNLKMIK